jgi:hypothetical protein
MIHHMSALKGKEPDSTRSSESNFSALSFEVFRKTNKVLPTMPPAFPRTVIFSLFLFPLLWLAMERTKFRTYVEVQSDAAGITLTVNGQSIHQDVRIGPLKALAVVANTSFYPSGCESLKLTPEGGKEITLEVPRSFQLPAPKKRFAGDWWVDEGAPEAEVFRQTLQVPEGFHISGVFTGRTLESFEIWLEGDTSIKTHFRSGNLNNDFGFKWADGKIAADGMHYDITRDLLYFIHPILAGLWAATVLIIAFGTLGWIFRHKPALPPLLIPWKKGTLLLLIVGTLLSFWVASAVLDARPHFQDDLGYLLRTKWLLAGRATLDVPPLSEHFQIPFTFFVDNKWMSQYPIGWPLLMALGQLFHLPWIIAPLCGLVLGYVTWRLGTECGGPSVGFASAALGMTSPFMQILSGSMMSHAAAAMWLALFTWLYVQGWKIKEKRRTTLALAGLALGLAFSTRPLAALTITLPAGIYGLVEMKRLGFFSKQAWGGLGCVILGGIAGSLPQLIDNWRVTGNPLLFAYTLCQNVTWSPGSYPPGLFWADKQLALVPEMAFGWTWPLASASAIMLALSLGFASVPFISGRARRTDWLLLGILISIPIAYMGTDCLPLHGFGPRFYADVFFALFILTARGFQVLGTPGTSSGVTTRLSAALFLLLTISTAATLPLRLSQYRGYNDVDDSLENALESQGVTRALILLEGPMDSMWVRVANKLPMNARGDLVFAQKLEDNTALLKTYKDRPVFLLTVSGLAPYTGQ